MRFFFSFAAAAGASVAGAASLSQKKAQLKKGFFSSNADSNADSFIKHLDVDKHRLRVCNAYPNSIAVDVVLGKGTKLTEDEPLPYKACKDFTANLRPGDKLEFRNTENTLGTFSVSELPQNNAMLFLAVYRHDTLSNAVSFASHVFASLLNAQIAVIDTYRGRKPGTLRIADQDSGARSEELRYDSVVAVNPGRYETVLQDPATGKEITKHSLVTLNREAYVVLRVGVESSDKTDKSYPEELLVFPETDSGLLRSAAAGGKVSTSANTVIGFIASVVLGLGML